MVFFLFGVAFVSFQIFRVSKKNLAYAKKVYDVLNEADIRVEIDDKGETMGNKIRKAQEEKIPYMVVLGGKEEELGKISVRHRDGEQENMILLEDFTKKLTDAIITKFMRSSTNN